MCLAFANFCQHHFEQTQSSGWRGKKERRRKGKRRRKKDGGDTACMRARWCPPQAAMGTFVFTLLEFQTSAQIKILIHFISLSIRYVSGLRYFRTLFDTFTLRIRLGVRELFIKMKFQFIIVHGASITVRQEVSAGVWRGALTTFLKHHSCEQVCSHFQLALPLRHKAALTSD